MIFSDYKNKEKYSLEHQTFENWYKVHNINKN